MHRLLVPTADLDHVAPTLSTEAARHLKVLRLKANEEVELFDGAGHSRVYAWHARLEAVAPLRFSPQAAGDVTLFACVTKGSRWDWTIEKATELGVTRIVPIISDRTIVRIPSAERALKRERWQRIAEDAARQSDAQWLPEICAAVDFKDVLPLIREKTCFIGALTTPPSPPLVQALAAHDCRSCGVVIGPEGDFTPEELNSLMAIAIPTSFGRTILRAETAAIFAVSILVGNRA